MDQLVSSKPMMPIATASLYSCRSPLPGRLGMDPQVLAQVQTAACVHAHCIRCMHTHSILITAIVRGDRQNVHILTLLSEDPKNISYTHLIEKNDYKE